MNSLEEVEDFLAQERLAFVGVSREAQNFSRALFGDLQAYGYDVVPVNPHTREIWGVRCYARLQDIAPPVDGVLIMTAPERSEAIVQDSVAAGIKRVWLHRGTGHGSVSDAAVRLCLQHNIHVVAGYCPYMFLPHAAWFHRLHGFWLRVQGYYPACDPINY